MTFKGGRHDVLGSDMTAKGPGMTNNVTVTLNLIQGLVIAGLYPKNRRFIDKSE